MIETLAEQCQQLLPLQPDGIASASDGNVIVSIIDATTPASPVALLTVLQEHIAHINKVTWVMITRQMAAIEHAIIADIPSGFPGFFRTLLLEYPQLTAHWCDVGDFDDIPFALSQLSTSIMAVRSQSIYVPRLSPLNNDERLLVYKQPYQLFKSDNNDLSGLALLPQELLPLAADAVELAVSATGLNFRDVLNALGLYPGEAGPLGLECAGLVTRIGSGVTQFKPGCRVFGLCERGFSTYTTAHAALLAEIPASFSDAEAAALPIVYLTAYICLIQCAHLKKGDRILIHTAAGGVGQAAIAIAQMVGATIYATASKAKHAYLRSQGITYCYNSRTTDFAAEILADTNNQGVDVILNALSTKGFIEASLSALKSRGHFVEIGKRNIWTKEAMHAARSDVQYDIIALDAMSSLDPHAVGRDWQIICRWLREGTLPRLRIQTYPIEAVKTAFHDMQKGRHIGKLVVTQPISPHIRINAQSTYIITGGLGGLGQIVCEWLLEQGAQHIILTTRSANKNLPSALATHNADIQIIQVDINNAADVQQLIASANKNWALKGIFHLAGLLDDGVLSAQTPERFNNVFAAKAQPAWFLHQHTQSLNLDYFVLFSSITGSMGATAQANYAIANSFLDQLALLRNQQNLPAISINWGPWAQYGMAANLTHRYQQQGISMIPAVEGKQILTHLLQQSIPVVQACEIDWQGQIGHLLGDAKWGEQLVTIEQSKAALSALLLAAEPTERHALLVAELKRVLRELLHFPFEREISLTQGFFEMGMDSLLAIDYRNRLQKLLGETVHISNTVVFDQGDLTHLIEYLETKVLHDIITHTPVARKTKQSDCNLSSSHTQ